MKKLMLAFAMLLTLSTVSFAQTKQSGKKKEKTAAAPTASSAKQESTAPVAPEMAQPAPSGKKAGPVKKDGTPDKRFKANKATDTVVHKKKDGTADKRFKENKKKN